MASGIHEKYRQKMEIEKNIFGKREIRITLGNEISAFHLKFRKFRHLHIQKWLKMIEFCIIMYLRRYFTKMMFEYSHISINHAIKRLFSTNFNRKIQKWK